MSLRLGGVNWEVWKAKVLIVCPDLVVPDFLCSVCALKKKICIHSCRQINDTFHMFVLSSVN